MMTLVQWKRLQVVGEYNHSDYTCWVMLGRWSTGPVDRAERDSMGVSVPRLVELVVASQKIAFNTLYVLYVFAHSDLRTFQPVIR